ncbi:MAG: TonB-dependent receptor [Prevotellaceae bacterium]|jgi:TonB-linked SusC/RagA family outer membrane protein|nr:TonB-dependent receptor [Prevotellaceae bacterium]
MKTLLKKDKLKNIIQTGFTCLFWGLLSLQVHAQEGIRVSGSVYDDFNQLLSGVSVAIKGTSLGTITDDKGEYVLNVPNDSSVLVFSLVGYQTYETAVGKRRIIPVNLIEQIESLEEVTFVAFGNQKKATTISSVESVNVADLKMPSSNLTSAFAGRIPGVISYQTSGEPGNDNAQFFVRGITTFGVKVDPLILIDGFESTTDDLARLQVDDIESFSVLKDALATVLYGARGANGILLINTKAGQEGPVKMSLRVDTHVATPTAMLELLDGIEYMRLYNQARLSRHPYLGPYYSEQRIQSTQAGVNSTIYPNYDWYDALFNKTVVNTKVNMNVSGGGKVANYYVSGGYDNESGLLKVAQLNNFNNNIDIQRYNLRSNVIFKLTPTTTLDARIQGRFEKYNGPAVETKDVFKQVMDGNPVDFPPIYPSDDAHRHLRHILFGSAYLDDGKMKLNPYAEMVKGYETRDINAVTAQITLSQNLDFVTQGLNAMVKVSANTYSHYSGKREYSPYYYALESYNEVTGNYVLYNLNPSNKTAALGDVTGSRTGSTKYYLEFRLNWNRSFGKHNLGIMTVGILDENLKASSGGSIYETLPERNLGNSGRVGYDYDSRYVLEFSYGYNGSEKFTGEKRFGFFPSVGAGWIASNEKFWKPLKNAISLMKFKFTWGRVGNDAIAELKDRFFYLSHIEGGGGGYQWGKTLTNSYGGYNIKRYANPDISWEESEKYNMGMELSLLKNEAIRFQIDFFKDYRSKIYMLRENYPATAGFESDIRGNVGQVSSRGIDGSIDVRHFFSRDLWITGRANFTYATNRYEEMDEPNYPDEYRKHVGQPVKQTWGLVAERLFVDEQEIINSPIQDFKGTFYQAGDIKYLDVNDDGKVNENDIIPIGYPTSPEIQYGFGLSAGYKKFDFSFFFQGNSRVSFFIAPNDIAPFHNRRNAPAVVARDSWSETNPDVHAFWPRLSTEKIENNIQSSTWWLREGGFLRLKLIEGGYNLPNLRKLFIKGSRLYFSIENLFYISKFKLWDPEVGGNGLGYPLNRRFNIGIQVSF